MGKLSGKDIINYILIVGLIAFSGFPFLFFSDNYLILFLFFTFIVWIVRSSAITKKTIYYILGFVLIFLVQTIEFHFFPFNTIFGIFIRIFIAFFILESLDIEEFVKKYISSILIFSIISFIFYLPLLVDESVLNFYNDVGLSIKDPDRGIEFGKTLLIFNLRVRDMQSIIVRNPGPFWEPGAFAGFLIIGVLFNKVLNNKFLNPVGIIFLLALISTFSTTGYLAYMFIIITFSITSRSNLIFNFVFIVLSISLFTRVPFLMEKIKSEKNEAISINLKNSPKNRVASMLADFEDVIRYPVFGRGPSDFTRYDNPYDYKVNNRNNGITDFLVKFGLLGFSLYFINMYYSIKKICLIYNQDKKTILIIFASIFLISFSEVYFMYPFFFALSLLQTVSQHKLKKQFIEYDMIIGGRSQSEKTLSVKL